MDILNVACIASLLVKEQLLEFGLRLLHLFPRLLLLKIPKVKLTSILRRVGSRQNQCRRLVLLGLLVLQLHHELVVLGCMLIQLGEVYRPLCQFDLLKDLLPLLDLVLLLLRETFLKHLVQWLLSLLRLQLLLCKLELLPLFLFALP